MNRHAYLAATSIAIGAWKRRIEVFKERLDKDPCDAFGWAETAMRAAVQIDMWQTVKLWLENTDIETGEQFLGRVVNKMMYHLEQGCGQPLTSTTHTMIDRLKGEAWKEFHDSIITRDTHRLKDDIAEVFSRIEGAI